MDRRELLRLAGVSAACAALAPDRLRASLAPAAQRRSPEPFFTPAQKEAVTALADRILPETDTPGAVGAGVPDYIEVIVSEWMTAEERERFMRGLTHVDAHTEALYGVRFAHAGEARQRAVLSGLEAEGRVLQEADEDPDGSFFHAFRGLVLHGYYTSEVGMKEELLFFGVPGRFEGCVGVEEVTRAVPARVDGGRDEEGGSGGSGGGRNRR